MFSEPIPYEPIPATSSSQGSAAPDPRFALRSRFISARRRQGWTEYFANQFLTSTVHSVATTLQPLFESPEVDPESLDPINPDFARPPQLNWTPLGEEFRKHVTAQGTDPYHYPCFEAWFVDVVWRAFHRLRKLVPLSSSCCALVAAWLLCNRGEEMILPTTLEPIECAPKGFADWHPGYVRLMVCRTGSACDPTYYDRLAGVWRLPESLMIAMISLADSTPLQDNALAYFLTTICAELQPERILYLLSLPM